MSSIWDLPALSFDDLPTLQTLLRKADRRILAREVARAVELDGSYTHKEAKRIEKMACKTIAEMRNLEAKAPSKKRVIFGCRVYRWDGESRSIPAEVDAVLLSRAEVKSVAKRDPEDARRANITPLDLSLVPWRKVLAYRVWLAGGFTRQERYRVLADAIWEMTFFGWSEKDSRKKQRKFLRELREDLEDDDPGIPGALAHPLFGLEASTDDYESEHDERMRQITRYLNERESEELCRRVADLGQRMARKETAQAKR